MKEITECTTQSEIMEIYSFEPVKEKDMLTLFNELTYEEFARMYDVNKYQLQEIATLRKEAKALKGIMETLAHKLP